MCTALMYICAVSSDAASSVLLSQASVLCLFIGFEFTSYPLNVSQCMPADFMLFA